MTSQEELSVCAKLKLRSLAPLVVRVPLKIHFVRQRAFYARTLIQAIVLVQVWDNSRAHHQNP